MEIRYTPKAKKAIKRIFIEFTSYMYVCSSSRILLKATAENSCEGFRSSFTLPLLLSLSFFMLKILCKRSKLLKSWILTIMDQFFNRNSFVCNEGLFNWTKHKSINLNWFFFLYIMCVHSAKCVEYFFYWKIFILLSSNSIKIATFCCQKLNDQWKWFVCCCYNF